MWGAYKRFVGVSLTVPLQHRFRWNWNALESFWFPGGEFNLLDSANLAQRCTLPGAQLPMLSDATVGQTKRVSIPLRALFRCLETSQIPNTGRPGYLGWSSPRAISQPLPITGVHFAIEHGPGQSADHMTTTFSKPSLVRR